MLLGGGAQSEMAIVWQADQGSSFTHPEFRELATQFVVAQARCLSNGCSDC